MYLPFSLALPCSRLRTALQLKQDPGEKLELGAANAADAPTPRVREQYGAASNTNVR